jgi:hypothetical protein
MSTPIPQSLRDVQRWMLDVITHPDGVAAGATATEGDATNALAGRKPHAVVARSKALTSRARIEIYGNMYFWRLQDCLDGDFQSVKYAVGDAEFAEMTKAYLVKYPSRYYNLNRLGDRFAAYIREQKSHPHRIFLAELAELERAIEVVFDAPRAPSIKRSAIRRIPVEHWPQTRIEFIPAFSLHAFTHPINAFVDAVRKNSGPAMPARQKTWVAVYRKNHQVWRMDLNRQQFTILRALKAGRTFGEALEAGLAVPGTDLNAIVGQLAKWFELWAARGFFSVLKHSSDSN